MPIRNFWSLEADECIVAEELLKNVQCDAFFPVHDRGVDLLAVRNRHHVGIQVKGSRYYYDHIWPSGHEGHSWHQVKKSKLQSAKDKVAFYVFLTYVADPEEHRIGHFRNCFLIVPTKGLLTRTRIKDPGSREVYSFCFHFEKSKNSNRTRVFDERVTVDLKNPLTNYTKFLDNWDSISKGMR